MRHFSYKIQTRILPTAYHNKHILSLPYLNVAVSPTFHCIVAVCNIIQILTGTEYDLSHFGGLTMEIYFLEELIFHEKLCTLYVLT